MRRGVESVWRSNAAWAVLARAALAPASLAFRSLTSARNALYDAGAFQAAEAPIPVISIGNLAVGGTGKTPVAAWMANELERRGARPAIVMRGYGDDEPRVHALMNPEVPVFVNADRVAAVREASRAGRDVAILDDGFQHRRLARTEDVVLVSADRWTGSVRLLPSGPWREAPRALRRASMLIVTRKAAASSVAMSLMQQLAGLTRTRTGAVASLRLDTLHHLVTGEVRPLSDVSATRALVIAGIGDPMALSHQLRDAGVQVELRSFPDHHAFSSSDIRTLAREARAFDHTLCTLKDAVKLAPHWPREGPAPWYVSLRCEIEVGGAEVSAMLDRVFLARKPHDQ